MAGLLGNMDNLRGILASPSTNDFALALLANSGYSNRRRGLGEIIGTSMLQSRQMAAEQAQQKLREQYMRAQIEAMQQKPQAQAQSPFANINPRDYTPESIAAFQQSGNYGDLRPIVEAGQAGPKIGNYNPGDFTTDSWATFLETGNPRVLRRQYAPQQPPAPWIGQIGGGLGVIPRVGGGILPPQMITTPEQERAAAAARAATERRQTDLAATQAKREATFDDDVAVIDEEILRTQRLLSEFEQGKYQTGPVAGRLPAVRTAAQDLRREQGKDVIRNISSATFGGLSEGERGFLRELGISETATEESNKNYLKERLAALKNAKTKLINRRPLITSQGAPAEGAYTHPSGATVEILPPAGK
jgi:hypothetical protein